MSKESESAGLLKVREKENGLKKDMKPLDELAGMDGGVDAYSAPTGGKNKNPALVNSAVLAFLGDAVYETYVRRYVYEKGILRPDKLNYAAVKYVRAETQALVLDRLQPELEPEEAAVARRGKNHKITSIPHNVDPKIYRKATAFEALVGYLELKGDKERLEFLIKRAFEIAESEDVKVSRK